MKKHTDANQSKSYTYINCNIYRMEKHTMLLFTILNDKLLNTILICIYDIKLNLSSNGKAIACNPYAQIK